MMKRVGAPAVSPDGKWVVFSVVEPSYDADKSVSDLWLVPTDGLKPPRRLTNTKAAEDDVAWSPDSAAIAFSTKREGDEVEQIYVLNLAEGGEARRLTGISTGAKHPQVAAGRQGHPVRVPGLSQCRERRGQQKDCRGPQGAQIQRADVRTFSGALLESMAG